MNSKGYDVHGPTFGVKGGVETMPVIEQTLHRNCNIMLVLSQTQTHGPLTNNEHVTESIQAIIFGTGQIEVQIGQTIMLYM